MVLKQKGKPEKGKKPVRGAPREFSDHREFPDGPIELAESDLSDNERSEEEESSTEESGTVAKNPTAPPKTSSSTPSNSTSAMSRREREDIQKEQARQHYIKMKEKEDGARLALVRKQREEAAAAHAEALRGKNSFILLELLLLFFL